jgi:hypothetical protein
MKPNQLIISEPNPAIVSGIYQPLVQNQLVTQLSDIYQPLVQRRLVAQLKDLITEMNQVEKVATAQVLLYQLSKFEASSLFKIELANNYFRDKIHVAFAIAEFLPKETLRELTIEILEEPQQDENG